MQFVVVTAINTWVAELNKIEVKSDAHDTLRKKVTDLVERVSSRTPFSIYINPRFELRSKWIDWIKRTHADVSWHTPWLGRILLVNPGPGQLDLDNIVFLARSEQFNPRFFSHLERVLILSGDVAYGYRGSDGKVCWDHRNQPKSSYVTIYDKECSFKTRSLRETRDRVSWLHVNPDGAVIPEGPSQSTLVFQIVENYPVQLRNILSQLALQGVISEIDGYHMKYKGHNIKYVAYRRKEDWERIDQVLSLFPHCMYANDQAFFRDSL